MSFQGKTRRSFLSAALVGLGRGERKIAGGFVNESQGAGHRLRSRGPFRSPVRQERVPLVIVGGGVAGLNAAWRLEKRGFRDFVLLEMEGQPGGVARWGENDITAYPWGAHYVPVPGSKTTLVRELFEDLGVLRDGVWNERYLCFSPQERLYLHARWQEGLEPAIGGAEQFKRFEEKIEQFRRTGQFTVPMAEGARPSALDRGSMADWMREQGFDSPYLRWYINYACRDDYGAMAAETSAWAGIHYFASREHEEKGPLTWPEGNGWIVRRLLERVGGHIRTGSPVYRIARDGRRWRVKTEAVEYTAECVIFAAPTFVAPYILEDMPSTVSSFEYSPWLTANLTLDRIPDPEAAWDNVIYDSPALGYVVATHQTLRRHEERSVWTFYWALARGPATRNRKMLLESNWEYWKEAILKDLERAHPDIRQCVSRIDIMRMGHAMVRPAVGFLSSEERHRLQAAENGVLFAHSDLSGLSLFEEAQYRGVTAAERALRRLGR